MFVGEGVNGGGRRGSVFQVKVPVVLMGTECYAFKEAAAGVDRRSQARVPVVMTGAKYRIFEVAPAAADRYSFEKAPTAAAGVDRRG